MLRCIKFKVLKDNGLERFLQIPPGNSPSRHGNTGCTRSSRSPETAKYLLHGNKEQKKLRSPGCRLITAYYIFYNLSYPSFRAVPFDTSALI
jgi:hypothetical protein